MLNGALGVQVSDIINVDLRGNGKELWASVHGAIEVEFENSKFKILIEESEISKFEQSLYLRRSS